MPAGSLAVCSSRRGRTAQLARLWACQPEAKSAFPPPLLKWLPHNHLRQTHVSADNHTATLRHQETTMFEHLSGHKQLLSLMPPAHVKLVFCSSGGQARAARVLEAPKTTCNHDMTPDATISMRIPQLQVPGHHQQHHVQRLSGQPLTNLLSLFDRRRVENPYPANYMQEWASQATLVAAASSNVLQRMPMPAQH